jgi:hypothetical protein
MMPGRLDEEASHMGVAGLGDRAFDLAAPTGVFRGNQAEVGGELARALKATDVVELGDESATLRSSWCKRSVS